MSTKKSMGQDGDRLTPSRRQIYIHEVVTFRMASWSQRDLEQFAYDRYYDEVSLEFAHQDRKLEDEYNLIQERREEWSE